VALKTPFSITNVADFEHSPNQFWEVPGMLMGQPKEPIGAELNDFPAEVPAEM
jgi:hypothetical protein